MDEWEAYKTALVRLSDSQKKRDEAKRVYDAARKAEGEAAASWREARRALERVAVAQTGVDPVIGTWANA